MSKMTIIRISKMSIIRISKMTIIWFNFYIGSIYQAYLQIC